eukprot:1143957-Pelagomonas_calceolata.AAC.3
MPTPKQATNLTIRAYYLMLRILNECPMAISSAFLSRRFSSLSSSAPKARSLVAGQELVYWTDIGASPTEVAELVSASKPFISCHGEESPSRVPWKRSLPDLLKGKAALGKQTNHMQSNQKGMLLCPKPVHLHLALLSKLQYASWQEAITVSLPPTRSTSRRAMRAIPSSSWPPVTWICGATHPADHLAPSTKATGEDLP